MCPNLLCAQPGELRLLSLFDLLAFFLTLRLFSLISPSPASTRAASCCAKPACRSTRMRLASSPWTSLSRPSTAPTRTSTSMPRRASTTCYRRSLPSILTAIRCWPRPSTTRFVIAAVQVMELMRLPAFFICGVCSISSSIHLPTCTPAHARTHAHELPAALICRPHATRPGLHGRHIFARLQLLYGLCQRSQVAYGQGEGRVGQNVECAIATACSKDFARLVTARGVCRTRLVVLAAGGDAKTKERCGKYKPNARKAPNGARRAQTKKN